MSDAKKLNELKTSIRKLGPESTEADFKQAFDRLNTAFPEQGQLAERRAYGMAILDIRERGFHPDAALVNCDKMEISEASDAGLQSLQEKLTEENHAFDPTGMKALADEMDADPAAAETAKGIGDEARDAIGVSKHVSNLGKVAAKVGGAALKSADVVENTIGVGKVVRNTYLAAKVIDELNRRSPKNPTPSDDVETPPDLVSERPPKDHDKLVSDLSKQDDPLETILDKDPADLTEAEVRDVMLARKGAETDDERQKLFAVEQAFFGDKYGSEAVKYDATGRMEAPKAVKPINEKPAPAKTDLKAIAEAVAKPLGEESGPEVAKALQAGLNILNRVRTEKGAKSPLFSELKIDGITGPKTRGAFKQTARKLGPAKLEEGMALGRFERFAEAPGSKDLRAKTASAFGDLFRKPSAAQPRSSDEGYALQATINDLGRDSGLSGFAPIREDGDVGPRTERAFKQVLPSAGAGRFTAKLGQHLGFFDDDDDVMFG